MQMYLLLFLYFNILKDSSSLDCPNLPSPWRSFKTRSKCYATRSLSVGERTYERAKSICSSELNDGFIADAEYESLSEFAAKGIDFVLDNFNIPKDITWNGNPAAGFFIGHSSSNNNGNIEHRWLSGRVMTVELQGPSTDGPVIVVVSSNPEVAAFYTGEPESNVGSVICQVPSTLQCPTNIPSGWLGFKTNKKCYIARKLDVNERTFYKAKDICESIDGMKLANLEFETEILFRFVPFVNDNIGSFDPTIEIEGQTLPAFHFDYETPIKNIFQWPSGKALIDSRIKTDPSNFHLGLVVAQNTFGYLSLLEETNIRGVICDMEQSSDPPDTASELKCPSVGDEWKTFQTTSKCYAIKYLTTGERTYNQAKSICESGSLSGNIADLEYEDLEEIIGRLVIHTNNDPSITKGIDVDGVDSAGFFIGHEIVNNGQNEYYWQSNREIPQFVIEGPKTNRLIAVANSNQGHTKFYTGAQESSVGAVLCEIPAEIECPQFQGFLHFQTNRKCYFTRKLEDIERSFAYAKQICESRENSALANLYAETNLLYNLVPLVNDNPSDFDNTILLKGKSKPGFYFDYTVAAPKVYHWPGNIDIDMETINDSQTSTHLALVVDSSSFGYYSAFEESEIRGVLCEIDPSIPGNELSCPDLPSGWYSFQSKNKCYATRFLNSAERSYEQAETICSNELEDGHILDPEYEDLNELSQLGIRFVKTVTHSISRDVNLNGIKVASFFIGHKSITVDSQVEYQWLSGRPVPSSINIQGTVRTSRLFVSANDNPNGAEFFTGVQESNIGAVLCQIPALLQCPDETINGWLSFKTNKKCYLVRNLESNERTMEKARDACQSVPGMKLADLREETELLYQLVPLILLNSSSFTNSIQINGQMRPGFYFDYIISNANQFSWPNGETIASDYIDTTQGNTHAALVVDGNVFGYYHSFAESSITGVICDLESSSGQGDPHMRHYIKKYGRHICYDLTGKRGDEFIMYTDPSTNTMVLGKLRDDFYFGSVIIQSSFYNKTISADNLWKVGEWLNTLYIRVEAIHKDEISLTIKKYNPTVLIITKRRNTAGSNYVNIRIGEMDELNSHGIFGDISKKNYIFYESIQTHSKSSISIEGKLFDAQLIKRDGQSCWFLSPDAAFYPKNVLDYLRN
ncbi:DgyrCDS3694 [Dimorphilus gyrociliatus]|uniref:DgyrCDS3694 n=1 Tax=Dimorphilus gyrociliatus TaxID=2664684 RepID=A0A7I8VJ85_9ANNE|nr:DgyrCDS3694 [Dimorphilus gyrociliatus]